MPPLPLQQPPCNHLNAKSAKKQSKCFKKNKSQIQPAPLFYTRASKAWEEGFAEDQGLPTEPGSNLVS